MTAGVVQTCGIGFSGLSVISACRQSLKREKICLIWSSLIILINNDAYGCILSRTDEFCFFVRIRNKFMRMCLNEII